LRSAEVPLLNRLLAELNSNEFIFEARVWVVDDLTVLVAFKWHHSLGADILVKVEQLEWHFGIPGVLIIFVILLLEALIKEV
jgi:hypothetical protein